MKTLEYSSDAKPEVLDEKRILIANDFSDEAADALVIGFNLASRENAELIVLNVEETLISASWAKIGDAGRVSRDDHFERIRMGLAEFIHNRTGRMGTEYLPVFRVEAVDGDPATQIVIAAFDNKVDLIVIGDHRKENRACPHLGHTAEMVVRYAPCSVLVVRQNKGELDLPPVRANGTPEPA